MIIRKTSAMVEAGILAAIAIVMAVISMYVPVLGAFANFLWPLPIIICGCRHGLKWSVMTLFVAVAIIAMLMSPINAFFLGAIFGLMGLIMGECLRRHLPPMRLMFYGSMGALVALVLNVVLSFAVLGIDPLQMMFESFHQSLNGVAEFLRSSGRSEGEIAEAIKQYKEMLRMMRVIMPGAFVLSAPAIALINYTVAKKVLSKLGETFVPFPKVLELSVPGWLIYPFALSLFAVTYFYNKAPNSWMYQAAVNVQTVTSFLFVCQGLILWYWYANKHGWNSILKNIVASLLFLLPIGSLALVYIGAFDIIMDFRRIRGESFLKRRK